MLRQAVILSERYITDRFLPDKAIDLLDEACAATALANKKADEYAVLQKEHKRLSEDEEKQMAAEAIDYEALANTRAELAKVQQSIPAWS